MNKDSKTEHGQGPLQEGRDFTFNERGQMVLSRDFLLRRGHCCKSGCANCPYEEGQNIDPLCPLELRSENEYSDMEKYIEMADEESEKDN